MLTYQDRLDQNRRKTIVASGLKYAEFLRRVEFHGRARNERRPPGAATPDPRPTSFMTLTIQDPQGKRIAPGQTWPASDTFLFNICTSDPFASLEGFGAAMAAANDARPNPYDFITLCGWMTSDDVLGDNVPINNSPALVEQMAIAKDTGLTRYTDIAVRLEPDYYCYGNQGDTQQGWFDDEHWAHYGALREPYETFKKFCDKMAEMGGKVFTYVQGSMPSNYFALAHPDWMLNDDISLLYEHRRHARTRVRYDYTEPGFKTRNGEYKRSCHDGCLRVPMIFNGPGFRTGEVNQNLASLIDLPRTVLSIASGEVPEDWQGIDLRDAVGNTLERDAVFAQISESHTGRAIRTKKWKYAIALPGVDWTWTEQEHAGDIVYQEAFLYDLESDPHERHNLITDPALADVRVELAGMLKSEMAKAGETVPQIKGALKYD